MIIAIDGESGTGKSTVAKSVSDILGWICIKTGDIYRQIAYTAFKKGIDCTNEEDIIKLLKYSIKDKCLQLFEYTNEDTIHSEEYARAAAAMAKSRGLKTVINNSIKLYIKEMDAVVEGRNVADSMFPEAAVKVLLFADIETRTERRIKQLDNNPDLKSVRESLQYRDKTIPSGNGHYDVFINTSNYDIEDTVSMILRAYYKRTHTRTLLELKHFLYSSYQQDTAYISCADEWNDSNPTRGHCAIVSMLVYEYFGGDIQRGYNVKKGEWHYWNVIDDVIYDFTKEQYKDNNICFQNVQSVSFETLMENNDTRHRYELLKERSMRIEKSFWEINDLILKCKKCLNTHTPAFETVSLGKKCEILVVGEAPAKNGWRLTGKAWINAKGNLVPTGKTLQKLLNIIGLDIDDISYMEAIKCYPEKGMVTKEHTSNCKDFCYKQIDILKPQIILSMGKYATEFLLGDEEKFSDMVGNTYSMTISNRTYTIIPIYHTSPASPLSYKGNLEVFEKIKNLMSQK